MTRLTAAEPTYDLGATVSYRDYHGRVQSGEVLGVKAHWRFGRAEPVITYDLRHQSYRTRRCTLTIKDIFGIANTPSDLSAGRTLLQETSDAHD